jgi:hypothetical protein
MATQSRGHATHRDVVARYKPGVTVADAEFAPAVAK